MAGKQLDWAPLKACLEQAVEADHRLLGPIQGTTSGRTSEVNQRKQMFKKFKETLCNKGWNQSVSNLTRPNKDPISYSGSRRPLERSET